MSTTKEVAKWVIAGTLTLGCSLLLHDYLLSKKPKEPQIPTDKEENLLITPEWLSTILQKSITAPISIKKLDGGISGPTLSKVTTNIPEIPSVVTKYLSLWKFERPIDERLAHVLLAPEKIMKKEIEFYVDLADTVRKCVRIPLTYFVQIDDFGIRSPILNIFDYTTRTRSLLVLEDLGHLRSIKHGERVTENEAKMALSSIAKLHATYWNNPPKNSSKSIFYSVIFCTFGFQKFLFRYNFTEKAALSLHEKWYESAPVLAKHFEDNRKVLRSLSVESKKFLYPDQRKIFRQNTLLHGDFHAGNIFIDDEKNELVLFDWQMWGNGSPSFDVASFLVASVNPEISKRLLEFYYAEMERNGVKDEGFSLEVLEEEVDLLVLGFCFFMIGGFVMDSAERKEIERRDSRRKEMDVVVENVIVPSALKRASLIFERYGDQLEKMSILN